MLPKMSSEEKGKKKHEETSKFRECQIQILPLPLHLALQT